jgi:glucan phosphorylase
MKMKQLNCEHEMRLYRSELIGLLWLNNTLVKIIKKGPAHPSYHKALGCSKALQTFTQHIDNQHEKIHDLESATAAPRNLIEAAADLICQEYGEA